MLYIYDLLLNFNDSERLLEFFEWSNQDVLEHVKKIPVFKISSLDMENIYNGIIKVDTSFLERINNRTILYKNKKPITYAALFCDLNKVIALEFAKDGVVLAKSCLLLDEEEEVIEGCMKLEDYSFPYKVVEKKKIECFLTRTEAQKKRYLLKEIESLYKGKDYDKLIYLYEEVFGKTMMEIGDKYQIIIKDIQNNYDERYQHLYDVVRLSYTKK